MKRKIGLILGMAAMAAAMHEAGNSFDEFNDASRRAYKRTLLKSKAKLTNAQLKERRKNKRAKQARKINR